MLQAVGKIRLSGSLRTDGVVERHRVMKNVGSMNQVRSSSSSTRALTRSTYFAPIYWDAPNDAVITSHKLLVQAGFIKKVRN